jgi:plastocyanin
VRRLLLLAAVLIAAAPAAASAQTTYDVGVLDEGGVFDWSDEDLDIVAGDTVNWCFSATGGASPPCRDIQFLHDVKIYTPDENGTLVAESPLFQPPPPAGASFEHTFAAAGEFAFICSVHPVQMNGTLTVTGGGGEDETAPVTTAALDPPAPGPGGTYTGPVEVTLTAADEAGGSGVESTEYAVDGGAFQPYTAPFTVSAEGAHTIVYRSTDVAGNVEADKQVAFTIDPDGPGEDETAPVTTAALDPAAPGPGGTYTVPVEVTLTAADEAGGSGVASTEYRIDGGAFQPYTAPFTVSAEGAHTIVYRSTDVAGNVEADKQVGFTIEPYAPGEADLETSVRPRSKRVKPGRSATFRVGLENVGGADAAEVKVCAKAPRRLVKITGGRCWTLAAVGAGASRESEFGFRPKRAARGDRVRIEFTTTYENGESERTMATLRVARG